MDFAAKHGIDLKSAHTQSIAMQSAKYLSCHVAFKIGLSRIEIGSPLTETIVGLAALALAIIGLSHIFPRVPASIAAIALGAALVFESGGIGRRTRRFAGNPPQGCQGEGQGIFGTPGAHRVGRIDTGRPGGGKNRSHDS